jgi:hypothetical protein
MKRCGSFQCAEPAAGLAVPYCGRHQREFSAFVRWLKGSDAEGMHPDDARRPHVSFDAARETWDPARLDV